MLRKILYTLITLGAVCWIGFAALDLVTSKDKGSASYLFGPQDGRILVINHPDECQLSEIPFAIQPDLMETIGRLTNALTGRERIYLSENQNHFAVERSAYWNRNEVQLLLLNLGGEFSTSGVKKMKWNGMEISYSKGTLDFRHPSVLVVDHDSEWTIFDKKSSYSLISFEKQQPIIEDVYLTAEAVSVYRRVNSKLMPSLAMNDENLFAKYLPEGIASYHFLERDFAVQKDDFLSKGPLKTWMQSGMVQFELSGSPLLLFDLIPGQDFESLLNEAYPNQKNTAENQSFEASYLSDWFKKDGRLYYRTIDDFVLISPSLDALNKAESALKLEKTLSLNSAQLARLFGSSPKKVSERIWKGNECQTTTLYNDYLISSRHHWRKEESKKEMNTTIDKDLWSLPGNGEIVDFLIHPNKPLMYIVNDKNQLLIYNNKTLVKELNLTGDVIGKLQWLDQGSLVNSVLITTKNALWVVNEMGEPRSGYPVIVKESFTHEAAYYGQSKSDLLVACQNNQYWVCNLRKGSSQSYASPLSNLSAQPQVWISQRSVFIGLRNKTEFVMIDTKKMREYRRFALPSDALAFVQPNELQFFETSENGLNRIDQKGNRINVDKIGRSELKRVSGDDQSFWRKFENKVEVYDRFGNLIYKLNGLANQSVDELSYYQKGNIYFTLILDGISNKILYFEGDKQISERNFKGSQKVLCKKSNEGAYSLFTVVDKYLTVSTL